LVDHAIARARRDETVLLSRLLGSKELAKVEVGVHIGWLLGTSLEEGTRERLLHPVHGWSLRGLQKWSHAAMLLLIVEQAAVRATAIVLHVVQEVLVRSRRTHCLLIFYR